MLSMTSWGLAKVIDNVFYNFRGIYYFEIHNVHMSTLTFLALYYLSFMLIA